MTRRGMTLIELLLAAGVGVLVVGGVFTALVVGTTAWRRLQMASTIDAAVALESFADRYANAPMFEAMPCEGAGDTIAFATLVNAAGPGETPAWVLGRVEYYVDADRQAWCVRELTYPAYLSDGTPLTERCLLTGVSSVTLQYLTLDHEQKTATWASSWTPPAERDSDADDTETEDGGEEGAESEDDGTAIVDWYPQAVRVTLVLRDAQGRSSTWVKSVAHPVR